MKIKSKYISTLVLTLMPVFAAAVLVADPVSADNKSADAVVNVIPACEFSSDSYTTTVTTVPGTVAETGSSKPNFEITCNGLNGWKVQAVGFSSDSTHPTGQDGLTSMYSPVSGGAGNFIATGTSGTSSYWSFKVTSVSSPDSATPPSISGGYGNYSNIPATAVDVANFPGDGAGGSITGTMKTDYQIYVNAAQAPGTYTGVVKYTIVVNP